MFYINQRFAERFNFKKEEEAYIAVLTEKPSEIFKKHVKQINTDLERTFPLKKWFTKGKSKVTGLDHLKNLLSAIAKRFPTIGYVQGMNFVAAALLFHSCEVVAFWLFVQLMNHYGLSDLYNSKLTGLNMHGQILDLLIQAKYEAIWEKMDEHGFKSLIFAMPWFLSLFTSVIGIKVAVFC